MILYKGDPVSAGSGFIIRPNQAMSWQNLMFVYLGISSVSITIAISFFVLGYTLILPFSGLEILALGAAFYLCAWRGRWQEVITISPDLVIVESGRQLPERRFEFPRSWVQVVLESSWNSWYPSRLLLRSHGNEVEVGSFLNEQERRGLALELKKALQGNFYNN